MVIGYRQCRLGSQRTGSSTPGCFSNKAVNFSMMTDRPLSQVTPTPRGIQLSPRLACAFSSQHRTVMVNMVNIASPNTFTPAVNPSMTSFTVRIKFKSLKWGLWLLATLVGKKIYLTITVFIVHLHTAFLKCSGMLSISHLCCFLH